MKSPFKFLDAYTREDREIFFGRDREIEEMYQKVFESKILLVYGISGTGKTSLIDCGLANKFQDSDWLPITVRRGANIIDSFIKELDKAAISKVKIDPGKGKILKALQSIYLDHFKPIYLIFDQFEELFIFGEPEEREEFITKIKAIVESDIQCRFIFSIREEYLASATEFELTIKDFLVNRMRVEKMTRQHAVEVIEGPCRVNGIQVEEGFSDKLLDKLNPHGKNIELTYLQVFLDKIFKQGAGSREEGVMFSKRMLEEVGDVSDLLGSFLEEQINELDDPDTGLVVLKAFVSMQGTKKQIGEEEISDFAQTLGKPIDNGTLRELLQNFVNLRLLRDKDENDNYELRHDSLAVKIFEKITLVEKELLEIKDFIINAFQNFERRGVYLNEADLKYIGPYEDKLFLKRQLEDFISDSKREIEKAKRRRRNIIAAAAIALLVIFAGFTVWAMTERKKAVRQTDIAEQQRTEAVQARDEANQLRQESEAAKDDALLQKALADSALIVAESERNTARQQRNIAQQQRTRAESLFEEANEQRQLAEESQQQAEQLTEEVIETNRKAMYQLYLFNAKEFANRSLLEDNNDTLKALLSLTAFDLVNYGYENYAAETDTLEYEITILEALQKAYMRFEPDSLFQGEIWAIDSESDKIVFSNSPGTLLITELDNYSDDKLPMLKVVEKIDLTTNAFVRSVDINDAKERIACGMSDGKVVMITNYFSGPSESKEMYKHDDRILSLLFVPDREWLISSSLDLSLRIWDIKAGTLMTKFEVDEEVKDLVLQNNDHLYFADASGRIFRLDLNRLDDEPEIIYAHDRPVHELSFNAFHDWLLAASYGEILIFKSVSTNNTRCSPELFTVKHSGIITSLEFSQDNRWLSSASLDGTVMLWDLNMTRESEIENIIPVTIDNRNSKIFSLNIDPQNKYLIYGDNILLHIYPVHVNLIYGKLKKKMGTGSLKDIQWEYYKKGDIDKPY